MNVLVDYELCWGVNNFFHAFIASDNENATNYFLVNYSFLSIFLPNTHKKLKFITKF